MEVSFALNTVTVASPSVLPEESFTNPVIEPVCANAKADRNTKKRQLYTCFINGCLEIIWSIANKSVFTAKGWNRWHFLYHCSLQSGHSISLPGLPGQFHENLWVSAAYSCRYSACSIMQQPAIYLPHADQRG